MGFYWGRAEPFNWGNEARPPTPPLFEPEDEEEEEELATAKKKA